MDEERPHKSRFSGGAKKIELRNRAQRRGLHFNPVRE